MEVIAEKIVLFIEPDSSGIERLKREMGEEAFYVAADDAMWYRAEAVQLLDSLHIAHRSVYRQDLRFMVDGMPRTYDWASIEAAWYVVLYDGRREPVLSSSIDLRNDLQAFWP
ncbi:MAG: hypothetical protein R2834_18290 [Rhodothermales bacterium]